MKSARHVTCMEEKVKTTRNTQTEENIKMEDVDWIHAAQGSDQ